MTRAEALALAEQIEKRQVRELRWGEVHRAIISLGGNVTPGSRSSAMVSKLRGLTWVTHAQHGRSIQNAQLRGFGRFLADALTEPERARAERRRY